MSSKLMDASTITQVVPWRIDEKEENHEVRRLKFDGTDRDSESPLDQGQPDPEPSPERSSEPVPIVADHSACERQIEAMEREIQRLGMQLADEKRVAYQQGLDAGAAQESGKWNDALVRSAKSVAELAGWKPRLRAEVETDAVRLSLAIAKKVLRREVNVDPGAIAGLLRVALEKVNARDVLRVRVSPRDAGDLSSRLGDFGLPVQVEVLADGGLERGSLVVDTTQGHIDASIDTQLSEIERGLADALDRGRGRSV